MTLPQLYGTVSLRSYDYISYSKQYGRPDGCGMASPFSMALNGLATRNVAGYVKKFRVHGQWKEHNVEECAKVGMVPDGSMLLNSLIRVAVEKMDVLDSFRYAPSELEAVDRCRHAQLGTQHQDAAHSMARYRSIDLDAAHGQVSLDAASPTNHNCTTYTEPQIAQNP